jgi:membrane protease YdiL (CAAX protease family)
MLPLADYITVQSGEDVIPEFMTEIYVSSQEAGMFFAILLTITLIVLAPLGEEILFRGFLFRGLHAGLGPAGAILLTALTWAALHVQYNWLFMAQILFFGIVLGWIRWRSGSLLLVMLLHAIINLLALVQVSVMLGA